MSAIAPKPAVPLETLVAEGDPTESMVEASKDANLLVLGIRGRSPFAGLLLGSVSQGAAATAHCPVVLVKRTDDWRGYQRAGNSRGPQIRALMGLRAHVEPEVR